MKIILAPDSFKGSLSAIEAAQAMKQGIQEYEPSIETVLLPMADGGEGTMSSLVRATSGEVVSVIVQDPLGRKVVASYGVLGDGETCVIEIAEASGLMLLHEDERDPLVASTYGTGELIVHALDAGLREFIIGLGGSATNDGGAGMLQALGMNFFDEEGVKLEQGGNSLGNLHDIDRTHFDERISMSNFVIACDVENPFVGPNGASFIFGPQKGASLATAKLLDNNLWNYANVVKKLTGISLHDKKGAGAAGGAAGAFEAFFQGQMKQGIDVVLKAVSFDEHLYNADLILTGEGKTDAQTFSGKTPYGIAKIGQRETKPVILISGSLDEECREMLTPLFTEVHAVVDGTISVDESTTKAFHYLKIKTKNVIERYVAKKQ